MTQKTTFRTGANGKPYPLNRKLAAPGQQPMRILASPPTPSIILRPAQPMAELIQSLALACGYYVPQQVAHQVATTITQPEHLYNASQRVDA